MRRRFFLMAAPLVAGTAFLLTGCPNSKPADPWASAGGKPKVLVSFAPLYSFAASVAGPDADVKCLLTTTGPHTHGDATAHQIDLYRGCDVCFINGLGLEDEADGAVTKLQQRVGDKKNVVNLGATIPEAELEEGACCHHDAGGREAHEHPTDPHVWLSPAIARVMVAGIRDELKKLDPAHAAGYDERAAAYLKKLDRLEAEGKALFANKQDKKILPFHESLQYFAKTFGLSVYGPIQVDPGTEPSQKQLDEVVKKCRNKNVRVIAVEPQFASHTSARVVRDALRGAGIDAVFAEVDPLETCDEADLGPELYEKVIRRNLAELAKALQ